MEVCLVNYFEHISVHPFPLAPHGQCAVDGGRCFAAKAQPQGDTYFHSCGVKWNVKWDAESPINVNAHATIGGF